MVEEIQYYCSSSTFLSIIKKSEIWLTSLDHSNDRLEGRWAINEYLSLFDRRDQNRRRGAQLDVERALSERVVLGMCFSEERDLLSQWRGYADEGRGVCLTFCTQVLRDMVEKLQTAVPGLNLRKVSYESIAINGLPKNFYEVFQEGIENFSIGVNGTGGFSRALSAEQRERENKLIARLFEHKNPAFQEEKEWRFFVVQFPDQLRDLDYREAGGLLSPFVCIPLDISAIEKVTLGPTHPTPLQDVEGLLKKFKIQADVCRSTASYVQR